MIVKIQMCIENNKACQANINRTQYDEIHIQYEIVLIIVENTQ